MDFSDLELEVLNQLFEKVCQKEKVKDKKNLFKKEIVIFKAN